MSTINDALKNSTPVRWAGSMLARATVANTNASTAATQVTLPPGHSYMVISSRGSQDFWVWVVAAGTSAPSKTTPTAGLQNVNGGGQARWEGRFDPSNPPEIWVAENGGSDDDFDILSQ